MPHIEILHGDCLDVLKTFSANSYDCLITDPPAGIGFMNRSWDSDKGGRKQWISWMTKVMTECLRVLKPGGHAVVWSIPRTSHWTATAVEDAGFEVRDIITHLFGSGFPHSLDVSKAIDKAAGAERQIVGRRTDRAATPKDDFRGGKMHASSNTNRQGYDGSAITAPSTIDAQQWQGWGTSLKPAAEFWILARKPVTESTIANNVLKYGTGAINVDATRICSNERLTGGSGKLWSHYRDGTEDRAKPRVNDGNGRWPANLVLSHSENCKLVGQTEVKARVINRFDDGAKPFGDGAGHTYTSESFGDENGNETIDVYECVPECAVRMLDEQSGQLTSGTGALKQESGTGYKPNAYGTENRPTGTAMVEYGDTGGASRFFYTSKASVFERNQGLSDQEDKFLATMGDGIGKREHNEDEPNAWVKNNHPTLKPLDLMRWLVRLCCKPGGLILDPFMGSGSTGCAAVIEGMNFTGIEQDEDYLRIATSRINYWKQYPAPYVLEPVLGKGLGRDTIVPVGPQTRPKPVDQNQLGLF